MTEEQQVAYIISQSVCAMIEAIGMQAANNQTPEDQPYTKEDFDALSEQYGIHHNAVIGYLTGR